jgi:hypothetical protein
MSFYALNEGEKKSFEVRAKAARAQFDALTKAEKEKKACTCALGRLPDASTKARSKIKDLNEKVASADLPQRNFPECLAIKAFDEASASTSAGSSAKGSSNSSKSSSNKSSSTSKSDSSNSDSSKSTDGGTSNDSSPAQKPDKISFQVLPSDTVSAERGKTATIKLVGGTPPYYVIPVDGNVDLVNATQTDLFVSYEVQLTRDSADAGSTDCAACKKCKKPKTCTACKKCKEEQTAKNNTEHRLLVADQSQMEVVYLKEKASSDQSDSGKTSQSSCPCTLCVQTCPKAAPSAGKGG